MAPLFDPAALPPSVRTLVEAALRDADRCEEAIDALEIVLGEERSPDALLAFALVTYQEASERMVGRRRDAAEQAIELIEEALERGAPRTSVLERFHRLCETTAADERRRERQRMARAVARRARPADLALLAHRMLLDGDDALAMALMAQADDASPIEEELRAAG